MVMGVTGSESTDAGVGPGAKLGITLPAFPLGAPPGRFYSDVAVLVEECGFDSFFAGDHMFGRAGNLEPVSSRRRLL